MWQKCIQWKKFKQVKAFLEENLFIAIPPLAQAILCLKHEYERFVKMSFVDVKQRENVQLFYFIEAQMLTYEIVRDELIKFRKEMIMVLCKNIFFLYLYHISYSRDK